MNFESVAPLWLLAPLLALLLLLRALRPPRRPLHAGSLYLWKRIAARLPAAPKRTFVWDASLLLQAACVSLLLLGAAAPVVRTEVFSDRTVALLIDNSPESRWRNGDGTPRLDALKTDARALLKELPAASRVVLLASSPLPRVLSSAGTADALVALNDLAPALSAPDVTRAWDGARTLASADGAGALRALSFRAGPGDSAWTTLPTTGGASNTGIVAAGAAEVFANGQPRIQLLIRMARAGAASAHGRVVAVSVPEGKLLAQSDDMLLIPGKSDAIVLDLAEPPEAMRVEWQPAGIANDALPEDDAIVLTPAAAPATFRIRFHQPQPALEVLFQKGAGAELAKDGDTAALDIFVRNIPGPAELATSKALLLIAPPDGVGSSFTLGTPVLTPARVQRAADAANDPLLIGLRDRAEGVIGAPGECVSILRSGDLQPLLTDPSGAVLLGRFFLPDGRRGYVTAFQPGFKHLDEAGAGEALDPPLAAVLLRLLREARGADPIYPARTAADEERALGRALPSAWRAGNGIAGVLDERATLAAGTTGAGGHGSWPAEARATQTGLQLAPWLLALALVVWAAERFMQAKPGLGIFG